MITRIAYCVNRLFEEKWYGVFVGVSPCLSLRERWPSAARTERVGTLRKHAAVASFLVCTASSFSPDLGSYAAVASIRTYTALSWIPSQSPTVTALPRGEPRAARCGHRALRNYPNTSFVSPSLRLRRHTSTFHFYRVPLLCKRKKPATQAFFFCFFIPWFR